MSNEPLCDPVLEQRIIEVVREHGSYRAAGKAIGINYVYLCRMKHGMRINPSDDALRKLGLEMRVTREIRRIGKQESKP